MLFTFFDRLDNYQLTPICKLHMLAHYGATTYNDTNYADDALLL